MHFKATLAQPAPKSFAALRQPWAKTLVATLTALTIADPIAWLTLTTNGQWTRTAQAQAGVNSTLAVIVVAPQKKAGEDAEAVERLLAEGAARLDVVRLFPLSPISQVEGTGTDTEAAVAELVENALRALLLRTPKQAQERIGAAVAKLTYQPMAGDERLFARLYKAQSLALLATGDLVPARDALLKSLVLVPTQTEEEYAAYGGQSKELFNAVKQMVTKGATGDFKIAVRGGKADIWIDGQWRGAGTAQANSLPVGVHRITVRQSGMFGERRFVEVVAGKSTAVEFDLKPAPFGPDLEQGRAVLATNFKQPSVVEDRMRELRNQLGADQMLVVRQASDKKATKLDGYFLSADGTFRKAEGSCEKDANYFEHLGEFLAEIAGAKLGPDPQAAALDLRQSAVVTTGGRKAGDAAASDPNAPLFPDDDDKKKQKAITSQWWFWTAVVAGAGLIGGGLYALTRDTGGVAAGAVGTVEVKLSKASAP
ncbi:MAG: hypothetical protein EXR77_14600 [Myxococcales bacterium]|nr:hypothetical protein [Myxococcales bacterium]